MRFVKHQIHLKTKAQGALVKQNCRSCIPNDLITCHYNDIRAITTMALSDITQSPLPVRR